MEQIHPLIGLTVEKTVLRDYWKVWENVALGTKKTSQMKRQLLTMEK